jgi:hypothetical protein
LLDENGVPKRPWLISNVGQKMSTSHQILPLDLLTAALGGRRLYTYLWALWLFAAIVGHYALSESSQRSSKIALITCVTGFVIYALLLLRGLVSKERRGALFSMQSGLRPTSTPLRILVWSVPVLALGAVLAPAFTE